MTIDIVLQFDPNTSFKIYQMPRTVALKSKPIELKKAIRLYSSDDRTIVGVGTDGAIYTSATGRYGKVLSPGASGFDTWANAMYRLGLVSIEDLNARLKEHSLVLEQDKVQYNLQELLSLASNLGVELNWTSYAQACKKAGQAVHIPEGYKLGAKGNIVKIRTTKTFSYF